jgi:hypothetical protein
MIKQRCWWYRIFFPLLVNVEVGTAIIMISLNLGLCS